MTKNSSIISIFGHMRRRGDEAYIAFTMLAPPSMSIGSSVLLGRMAVLCMAGKGSINATLFIYNSVK